MTGEFLRENFTKNPWQGLNIDLAPLACLFFGAKRCSYHHHFHDSFNRLCRYIIRIRKKVSFTQSQRDINSIRRIPLNLCSIRTAVAHNG